MERTIDRTSYRRNARTEIKEEKIKEEKRFSYIRIILNQIIISLLIIIAILTAKYFDIDVIDKWITENMSGGYEMTKVLETFKNIFVFENGNTKLIYLSGDNISGENCEIVSGEISGEISLKTAVEGVNQMLIDAEIIKEKFEFVVPVKGVITSEFGCRVSDNKVVSSYHTGLDIAANTGTEIYAAHDGIVTKAENFSSYGKCIIIENGDLLTLYAHCSSLNVKQGEKVNKGDFIGKVGMTGNATGPHLHFEVRYQERYINPENILGEI